VFKDQDRHLELPGKLPAVENTPNLSSPRSMVPAFRLSTKVLPLVLWCGALALAFSCEQANASLITKDVTVSHDQSTVSATVASPAFSTAHADELLLAFITADEDSTPNTTVESVSGGGLVWTLVVRTNTQGGTSEIWRAFAPAMVKSTIVTATLSQSVVSSITVSSYSGVAVTGTNGSGAIGATGSGHSAEGAPTATLTTTQNNSLVVGVGDDYDNAIARTPLTGQTIVHQDLTSTGDTYWVQTLNAPTPTKGTKVTVGDSAPTTDQYNLSICEILPAPVGAELQPSASTLNFGLVPDGSKDSLTLTLTSAGTSSVTLTAGSITGAGFSIPMEVFPVTLAPGQTLAIPVTFAPVINGAVVGKLTIDSNSTTGTSTVVTLDGSGVTPPDPKLALSATTLPFGSVADGTSKSLTLTLSSTGITSVTVSSASITGTGFSIQTTGLPATLSPGQKLTLSVNFAPATAGAVTGTLTLNSNSTTGSSSVVTLSGTGTAAAGPTLALSTTALPFGSVTDGSSKSLTLTLSSTGTSAVTVSSASITGTGFSLPTTGLAATLSPGQTLTLSVKFAPATAGAVTGTLTINSNSTTGSSSVVTLSGTGTVPADPTLALSANTLPFGSVADGSSKSLTLTLSSTGTSAVTVSSASITGTGFSLPTTGLPATLAPGQSLTLSVNFAPTTAGAVTGTLTINSNSTTGATAVVPVTGTGAAVANPILALSATSLSFGNVSDGSPEELSLTLNSTGSSAVTVSSDSIAGTGFSITAGTLPAMLNPGSSLSLTIQFLPTSAGAVSGQLTINSNSTTGSVASVALSGTGTTPQSVSLTWSPPTSTPVAITGYNIYRSISGGAYTMVNSSLDTQTTFVDTTVAAGEVYDYEVDSVDAEGVESAPSNVFSVTVPTT